MTRERQRERMNEVKEAAMAVFASYTEEEEKEIRRLFKSIDKDGDGRISIQEFRNYLANNRASGDMNKLFKLIDHNRDGFLQLEELFTLYYMEASGRPTCRACGILILSTYFTCTPCRLANHFRDYSFDLCVGCYRGRKFEHHHSEFDDNYTLLRKMQDMLLDPRQEPSAHDRPSSSSGRKRDKVKAVFKGMLQVMAGAALVSDCMGVGNI